MIHAEESGPDMRRLESDSIRRLLELAVIATSVAGILYFGYFQLAPWIWSQNVPFKSEDILIWTVFWMMERDGIELYALYALMFLDLFFVCALCLGWDRLAGKPVRYLFALPLAVTACVFIGSVGFHPPMSSLASHAVQEGITRSLTVMAVILPIILLLYFLQQRSAHLSLAVAALLLIPVCFIATQPLAWYDYQYILSPALRLFYGAGVAEIYFRYDFLLSLIGLAWMKLRIDLNLFQVVGQFSYYLLLLVLYAFSKRWFLDKRLPVFLLVSLVLVRIYTGIDDAAASLQVTPLRLDMWLPLLLLLHSKGPSHWGAGLFCGLMLLLHHNFGIIYSIAYIQLMLTLCIIDSARPHGGKIKAILTAAGTLYKKNYLNLAFILAGALAYYILFRNPDIHGDFDYVRLGISFTKITTHSFYWYVVIVVGLSFMLLLKTRTKIPSNYLACGFCLIYLAIGNSLYFFGRSEENNIINISVILLLLFFLFLDIAGHTLAGGHGKPVKLFIHRNLTVAISLAFIVSVTIWYGDRIADKVATQAVNARNGQLVYPSEIPRQNLMDILAEVKSITGNSPKVYFIHKNDFLLDYYGGYAPVGYYNPLDAWVSRREFNKFLQILLDRGYYLVIDYVFADYVLPHVKYSNYRGAGKNLIVWK